MEHPNSLAINHARASSAQTETQGTDSHSKPEHGNSITNGFSVDPEVDAAFVAYHSLQSGVNDPAENPSSDFQELKHDLMRAIVPYDPSGLTDKEHIFRAGCYNDACEHLRNGNYDQSLAMCDSWYKIYFSYDGCMQKQPRSSLSMWEAVHCFKISLMRMMILPFVLSVGNIFRTRHTMYHDRKVLEAVYGKQIPKPFEKPSIFTWVVCAERVRFLRRSRQAIIGEANEKEEFRGPSKLETDEEIREAEKAGFLPVNDQLLRIRYEALFLDM
ncbi:MAG: hypothetical protein Q9178_000192 [Gyalolechia marmorata]